MANKKPIAENEIGIASTGNVDWSVFLQEGVIVTLIIKRYRGTASVDFSELGIDDTTDAKFKSVLSEYIMPGTKRLIPPEIEGQLKSIETSARNNLKEKGFDCAAFASNGKFIPNAMYAEFKKVNQELQERFYAIRDEFSRNYDGIVEHVRKDYKVLAENLYMQSNPTAKKPSPKYVKAFVDKIIEQIPSADEIVASFEYTTLLSRIPSTLLNVISKKQNIDERVMRIAATNQGPTAAAQALEQEKLNAKKEKTAAAGRAVGMASADAALLPDDAAALDEIEHDIQESIKRQSTGMAEDFLTDILVRVRTEASEGAESIVRSIEKNNGKLVGRASIKAHSLVDDLKKKNFYGDKELDAHVSTLEHALGTDKTDRDIETVKKAALELKKWADGEMDIIHSQTVSRKAPAKSAATSSAKKAATAKKQTTTAKPATKSTNKATATSAAKAPAKKPAARKPKNVQSQAQTAAAKKPAAKSTKAKAAPKKRTIKRRS